MRAFIRGKPSTAQRNGHWTYCEYTGNNKNARRVTGFTLIELMLVIGVMIALTAATLPAFRSLKEGNRVSGGINAVSASLNSARSIAAKEGHDVAVMFQFDEVRLVCSMLLIEEAGTTNDAGNGLGEATIFVPVKGQKPISLPPGAAVFGYGYGATRIGDPANEWNWYADLGVFYKDHGNTQQLRGRDPWLFPRTDVRMFAKDGLIQNVNSTKDPLFLESFIVRFNPQGTVVSSSEELAKGTSSGANDGYLELDALHTDNNSLWKRTVREWSPNVLNIGNGKYEVIPELQLRSVPFLAVVDLYKMGAELGVRQPWLTVGKDHPLEGDHALWDARGTNDSDRPDHLMIDQWIDENASILTFNRFTGNVMKEFRR